MRCENVDCPNANVHIYHMYGDEESELFALCPDCAFQRTLEFLQRHDPQWFMAYTNPAEGQRRYELWQEYQQARQTFEQPYHKDMACVSKNCGKLDKRVAEYYSSSGTTLALCRSCAVTSDRVMRDRDILISREYYNQIYTALSFRPFDPL